MRNAASQRTWFITGASCGVGRELTLMVLRRGERVAAAARQAHVLHEFADRFPTQLLALPVDVSDEGDVDHAVACAAEVFGRIDVVVNCAGYGLFGPVEQISDEQARATFDTNFFGVLNVLRSVLPLLRRQRAGHVVQMSSIFGHMSYPGTGLLAATKHAVSGVTEALAQELAPFGVTFTMMEPAAIDTGFLSHAQAVAPSADYAAVEAVLTGLSQAPPEARADPRLIAAAIMSTADSAQPPPRVALGPGAEEIIRSALATRLRQLDLAATRG